jgi:hypothetical protein
MLKNAIAAEKSKIEFVEDLGYPGSVDNLTKK